MNSDVQHPHEWRSKCSLLFPAFASPTHCKGIRVPDTVLDKVLGWHNHYHFALLQYEDVQSPSGPMPIAAINSQMCSSHPCSVGIRLKCRSFSSNSRSTLHFPCAKSTFALTHAAVHYTGLSGHKEPEHPTDETQKEGWSLVSFVSSPELKDISKARSKIFMLVKMPLPMAQHLRAPKKSPLSLWSMYFPLKWLRTLASN